MGNLDAARLYRVLLVEDDEVDCQWVSRMLKSSADVRSAQSAAAAREILATERFDCLILDLGLPDIDGLEFVSECASLLVPIVVLTGQSGLSNVVAAMQAGAHDYLVKDNLNKERLGVAVAKAIEKSELQRKLETNQARLELTERVLSERERRLSLIVENINEVFWIADPTRDFFVYVSPQSSIVWGLDPGELKDEPVALLERMSLDDRARVEEQWSSSQKYEIEYRIQKDGQQRWLREKAVLTSEEERTFWVGTTEDITQRKQLEAQFRTSQRMEELGRLAGGLSHDFNNLLTCILGYTGTAREALPPEHSSSEDLSQVEEAGRQAQRLIKQLLGFCKRKGGSRDQYCDINLVVRNLTNLLARTLGESIRVELDLPGQETYVGLPRTEVEQILLNLAVNAKDAMTQGGRLSIGLRLAAGKVNLVVSDSGMGMDECTQARLFDAFYTTKGDRGTGLGLFTVSEILERCGGSVSVSSVMGRGTTFEISLPALEGQTAALLTDSGSDQADEGYASVKILLAENRPELGELFDRVLSNAGHGVTRVLDGLAATMLLAEDGGFELLVTDIQMPGIGGAELARRVMRIAPHVPILYISGQPDSDFHNELIRPQDGYLEKPFSGPELIRAIDRLLSCKVSGS